MKTFTKQFFLCGIAGWCWECFWTGLSSLLSHEHQLLCRTSLWMFPIYGAAAVLCPLYKKLKGTFVLFRAFIYAIIIFLGEFISGTILKCFHACPWSYNQAKLNINGIVRLDYLPAWMLAGLLFEKLVLKVSCESCSTDRKAVPFSERKH